MSTVYTEDKEDDGFLYITFSGAELSAGRPFTPRRSAAAHAMIPPAVRPNSQVYFFLQQEFFTVLLMKLYLLLILMLIFLVIGSCHNKCFSRVLAVGIGTTCVLVLVLSILLMNLHRKEIVSDGDEMKFSGNSPAPEDKSRNVSEESDRALSPKRISSCAIWDISVRVCC